MNWLKKIWKGFSEPLPAYTPSKSSHPATTRIVPINPSAEDESLSNFTPRAQQVLALARKETNRLQHNFVGTEHLLLGLLTLGQGVAVKVLLRFGVDLESVRKELEQQIGTGPGQEFIGCVLPFTPRVKRVLALAKGERRAMNHTYVGTEHLLLGMLREGDGVAARVLRNLKVEIEQTRLEILKELDPNFALDYSQPSADKTGSDPKPPAGDIDLNKRYDVYCSERQDVVVVYRNVIFKGLKMLIREDRDLLGGFYELEQSDGSGVFVAKYSVIKFCAPGTTLKAENVPGAAP